MLPNFLPWTWRCLLKPSYGWGILCSFSAWQNGNRIVDWFFVENVHKHMQSIAKSGRFIFFLKKRQKQKRPYTSSLSDTQLMIQTNCQNIQPMFAAALKATESVSVSGRQALDEGFQSRWATPLFRPKKLKGRLMRSAFRLVNVCDSVFNWFSFSLRCDSWSEGDFYQPKFSS